MTQAQKSPLHWIDPQSHSQTQWASQYLEKKGLLPYHGMGSIQALISTSQLPTEIQLIAKNMRAAWYAHERRKKPNKIKTCNWEISRESYKQLQHLSATSPMNKTIEDLISRAFDQRQIDSSWLKKEKEKLKDKENSLKKKQQELDLKEDNIGSLLDTAPQKARDFAQIAFLALAQHLWTATYERISSSLITDKAAPLSPEDQEAINALHKEQQEEIVKPLRLLAMNSTFLKKSLSHKNFTKRLTD